MDAALASTYAEAELGIETVQFQIGTLPALLRKSAVCQCSRFLGSSEWLMLRGVPIQFLGMSPSVRNRGDNALCCYIAGQCSPLSQINSGDQSSREQRLVFRISEGLSLNLVWIH